MVVVQERTGRKTPREIVMNDLRELAICFREDMAMRKDTKWAECGGRVTNLTSTEEMKTDMSKEMITSRRVEK